MIENVRDWSLNWLIITVFIASGIVGDWLALMIADENLDELIVACEKPLPRTETCELIAVKKEIK
jgi:hypothetical protein